MGDPSRGVYFQWLFFGPSCIEPAMMDKGFPREKAPPSTAIGYRDLDAVLDVVSAVLAKGPHLMGEPFTAADVKCTWDLLTGKGGEKLRVNPRKSWYSNLQEVTTNGDFEVTFHLKRPQPWLLTLLASGWSPVYPCHVPPREMRQHPIGTGPFKFVDFKPNESIKLVRNPDYWKPGRPYLDGIEYTIMREIAPRNLAFFAGKFDVNNVAAMPGQYMNIVYFSVGLGAVLLILSRPVKKLMGDVQ